jgi:hypothetical protein
MMPIQDEASRTPSQAIVEQTLVSIAWVSASALVKEPLPSWHDNTRSCDTTRGFKGSSMIAASRRGNARNDGIRD